MAEQLAGAESNLNQLICVKLGELSSLLERGDKVSAVGNFFGRVDDLVHVEAAAILFEDQLENFVVRLSCIFPRTFEALHRIPNFVRLQEGL